MKWEFFFSFEDKDFLNTGRQAKNKKFQKSQSEEQKESRTKGNHNGVREGTSRTSIKQQTSCQGENPRNLGGGTRRIKIKAIWMKENLHTSPKSLKGSNPYEELNLTKSQKTSPPGRREWPAARGLRKGEGGDP